MKVEENPMKIAIACQDGMVADAAGCPEYLLITVEKSNQRWPK